MMATKKNFKPRKKLYMQYPHKENYKYSLKENKNCINENAYHVP